MAKAERVRGRLARIRQAIAKGRAPFVADEGLLEQAAFNVFLAMQECLDIASHVVADEGWGAPATLAEAFDLLERHGVVTPGTATAMRSGTKLRNLIAHAYGDLDAGRLYDSAAAGVGEIERFLAEVGDWMGGT